MTWITGRGLILLVLVMLCWRVGRGCNNIFAKKSFVAVVPACLSEGEIVFTVQILNCNPKANIYLNTNDDRFGIHLNGSIYSTQYQTIDSIYRLQVLGVGSQTHEIIYVDLIPSSNSMGKKHEVVKEDPSPIYLRARSNSRRQKREWINPPISVREENPNYINPIAQIRSDKDEINQGIRYRLSGPGATEDPFGLFLLDPETGKINITGIVDREKTPVFEMIAQAYDRNNNPLENRLPIRIKILDINDNPPVFTQEVFHGSIEEWSPLSKIF